MIKGVDRREFLLGAAAASALPGANYLAKAANAAESSTNSSARLLVGCCALS
jgi:hypothetical protein